MDTVSYAHIEQNAQGEAVIAGTRIKVRMIALDRIAHNWDAEEIQRHHPDLSLGQVHWRSPTTTTTKTRLTSRSKAGMSASRSYGPARTSRRAGELRERGLLP